MYSALTLQARALIKAKLTGDQLTWALELIEDPTLSRNTLEGLMTRLKKLPDLPDKTIDSAEQEQQMASRMSGVTAVVKRCEKVGWKTTRTTDGIRVTTPQGPVVVHLTPSDGGWSTKLVTQELEKKGLTEAEEALEMATAERRKNTLAAGRAKAEAATVAAQKRAASNGAANKAALARAAGPYLVEAEDVDLDWFAKEHPSPWMRWVYITPDIAEYLLENHNLPGKPGARGTNRPQSDVRIEYYRDIIVSGQWHLTHQGMAMDTLAKVQDGQHRLAAIRDAGELIEDLKVPVAFFVGMAVENFKAIDDVLLRDAKQLFTMAGEKNGGTLRTATRLIIAYRSGDPRFRARRRINNMDSLNVLELGADQLRIAASVANSHGKKVDGLSHGPFAAAHYLLHTTNGADNPIVEAFFHGLLNDVRLDSNTKLPDDDPRKALRTTLLNFKLKGSTPRPLDQLGLIIQAWNYMVLGKGVRTFRWTNTSDIPEILLCQLDGENASAIPRALVGEISA